VENGNPHTDRPLHNRHPPTYIFVQLSSVFGSVKMSSEEDIILAVVAALTIDSYIHARKNAILGPTKIKKKSNDL